MRPCALLVFAVLIGLALPLRAEPSNHWAYQPVVRPELPSVANTVWPQNAIDYFILARQEAEGSEPAPAASREHWLRRATFDLTGLPPSIAELDAFLADASPDAYERVVDRLLNSPRYGERMATHWLDLARYADTHGYYVDSHRDMWRYRDEVIAAFNRHQAFDQFTVEQLAGDLLPKATLQQRIASGFNRNHLINFEPGALPEEYLNEYVVDRTATTATVWLGQTIACAQCHDHKHDPFNMRDFYSLAAFFSNIPEEGLDGRRGNAMPLIKAPTREQQRQLDLLDQRLAEVSKAMTNRAREAAPEQALWERRLLAGEEKQVEPPRDVAAYFPLDEEDGEQATNVAIKAEDSRRQAKVTGSPTWIPARFNYGLLFDGETFLDAGDVGDFETRDGFSLSLWAFPTTADAMTLVSRTTTEEAQRGYELYLEDGHLVLALRNHHPGDVLVVRSRDKLPRSRWTHVAVTYDGSSEAPGVKLYLQGVVQSQETARDRLAGGSIQNEAPFLVGKGTLKGLFRGMLDEIRVYARPLTAAEVASLVDSHPVLETVSLPQDKRTPQQAALLAAYYLEHHDREYQRMSAKKAEIERAQRELLAMTPTTMVMAEATPPRDMFILERGDYRRRGEKVIPNTPASLPPMAADLPRNRLGLARWLTSGEHPLTARVVVNRLWQLHFSEGLVTTPDDFGTLGALPSHPELLDWLADEFVRSGWDVQHIQRLIVTSATYRQRAVASGASLPMLTGFPRQRLSAEMLRDQALAASGLLTETMYGPGVSPYQPPGLWEEIGLEESEFSVQRYQQGSGADLYRRSVYTFWKRTSPAPNMTLFDAPDRQVCVAKRETTNTPLQALVLWNDPTYVEAARQLAAVALHEESSDRFRISFIFRRVLGRAPSAEEEGVLERLLARQRWRYRKATDAAERLLAVGDLPPDAALDPAELAAWTVVAHTVLNLDEALSRN